jgi:hypothetical protein
MVVRRQKVGKDLKRDGSEDALNAELDFVRFLLLEFVDLAKRGFKVSVFVHLHQLCHQFVVVEEASGVNPGGGDLDLKKDTQRWYSRFRRSGELVASIGGGS